MFVCWLVPQLVIQTLIKGWIQDSFLIFFNIESEGTVRCFGTFFFFLLILTSKIRRILLAGIYK